MEAKRQRKRINYARLSRVGHEDAKYESPQSSLPCTSCGRKLAHIPSFLMHLLHCTTESHDCPQCIEPLIEQSSDDPEANSKSTKTTFSSVEDLDKHVIEYHLNSTLFSCYVCSLSFPTLSMLQKHQVHDHKIRPNTKYEERKVDFYCTGCQEQFQSGNQLAKHFSIHPTCAGNLMLWQCVDPETDAENDILIRLRECRAAEEMFMARFPSARLGLNLLPSADTRLIKPVQPQTIRSSPKKSATPAPKTTVATPKLLTKPKSQTPKVRLFPRKKPGQNEVAKAVAAVNKKKKRTGRPNKRTSPLSDIPIEVGTKTVMMTEQKEMEEDNREIESPKRRKLDEASISIMQAEEEQEDLISSPEAPFGIQGSSPGLEPEGEEDEEVTQPQSQSLEQICDMTSDTNTPNDDSRVAHAVEVMACRACGITFDLMANYTAHMRTIHDLELPSPSNRARGRPRKKAVNENDQSAAMMMEHAVDEVVSRVNKALYESHQSVHWADDQILKNTPKKRGRKTKRAELTTFGDSITRSPVVSKGLLCPLCPDKPSFISCDARESHLATLHDGERAFGCQVCGETFSLFYELQLHNRQEHDIGNGPPTIIEDPARAKLAYKCVVCKVGFQDETILQRHYDAMHTLDEGEQYHCPVCYFTYSGCRTRDDHVLKKHPDARAFKCPVCEARFASFEVFRAHEKRAHISQKTRLRGGMSGTVENAHVLLGLTEKPKKPRRKLAAAMRGALSEKSNDSAEAIAEKRRKTQMYKEGTLYCEKCNEDCANEEELDIHTKEHVRKEKRFGCTQCGRVFSGPLARSFLVDHIKLEHMHQSAYACDDCDQRFYYKVQSDRHRTVDRDSGVASCKRVEDLNVPLPRLVFGCSRCAKIFAGDGAQSRYSEHQLECVSNPPGPAPETDRQKDVPPPIPPPAPQSPLAKDMGPGMLQVKREENEVALAISEAVGVIGNSIDENETENIVHQSSQEVEQEGNEDTQGYAGDAASNVGLIVTDEAIHSSQRQDIDSSSHESNAHDTQQTVIVLPSTNPDDEGEEGQVVVLPEDVLSNVRAAGLGDDGGGSVVLIQAEDGTLIVASEEQLAELQMQEHVSERVVVRDMLQGDTELKDDTETMSG